MLVSTQRNEFDNLQNENPSSPLTDRISSARVRIRTLHVCEPSYPPREVVRKENYARRQAQKYQGWTCPAGIPYQGIDPVHLPPKPSKQSNEPIQTTTTKPPRPSISAASSTRPKSSLTTANTEENAVR